MGDFLRLCGLALVAAILILALGGHRKEIGALLGLAMCCMAAMAAIGYLQPVVQFVKELETLGNLDHSLVKTMLKVVGIGMIAELAALICADAGNASLGKTVQMLGSAVILYVSMPLFTALITLIQQILGEL